jgi:uncharacterized protein
VNPFLTISYEGADYFCDREAETKELLSNSKNGRNTLLLSPRRLGKTSLIKHLFHQLPKWNCLYVDLNETSSVGDLLKVLSSALANASSKKMNLKEFLTSWKMTMEFDPYTGSFSTGMNWVKPSLEMKTVEELFNRLSKEKNVLIAFDEFQRITEYPESNTEGWLRGLAQKYPSIRFIFSGSHQRILQEMFNSHKRPFYRSSDMIKLTFIDRTIYSAFIQRHFKTGKKHFSESSLPSFIYDQMGGRTAYIQEVCNRLYELNKTNLAEEDIFLIIGNLVQKYETHFTIIKRGLTAIQFRVLWAIAKLDKVYATTGSAMLKTSNVHNAVSIQKAVEKLLKIEVIYADSDQTGDYVTIGDVFLRLWLLKIQHQ